MADADDDDNPDPAEVARLLQARREMAAARKRSAALDGRLAAIDRDADLPCWRNDDDIAAIRGAVDRLLDLAAYPCHA